MKRCNWYHRIRKEVQQDPASRPEYQLRDGRLYRHILHTLDFKERSSKAQWKLCVPTPVRKKVMETYHNEPTAGHLGIAKTIARIAEEHYWPGMFRDVAKYVRMCNKCQSYKVAQQKPAGKLHAANIKRPWEQVTIDLVGPLSRSKRGKYLATSHARPFYKMGRANSITKSDSRVGNRSSNITYYPAIWKAGFNTLGQRHTAQIQTT